MAKLPLTTLTFTAAELVYVPMPAVGVFQIVILLQWLPIELLQSSALVYAAVLCASE